MLTRLAEQLAAATEQQAEGAAGAWTVACASRTSGGRAGMAALLGPGRTQLAVTLLSLLPWILSHCQDPEPAVWGGGRAEGGLAGVARSAAAALAGCCRGEGLDALASALEGLPASEEAAAALELPLRRLAAPLAAAFFPRRLPLPRMKPHSLKARTLDTRA